jgi:hypothetical protein
MALLTTCPSFMAKEILRTAEMSLVGSPFTATRSAKYPSDVVQAELIADFVLLESQRIHPPLEGGSKLDSRQWR